MAWNEAQREARSAFVGGSVGQIVSGAIWLLSAALGTWAGRTPAILALFFGGMLIFPLTQLSLRLIGRRGALSRGNPLNKGFMLSVLAMAAGYPLVYIAARHNINWFYPAFMVVVGLHYLSFIVLYGMRQYGALATLLVAGGLALAALLPSTFSAGAWLTGTALVLFGLLIWVTMAGEPQPAA